MSTWRKYLCKSPQTKAQDYNKSKGKGKSENRNSDIFVSTVDEYDSGPES